MHDLINTFAVDLLTATGRWNWLFVFSVLHFVNMGMAE